MFGKTCFVGQGTKLLSDFVWTLPEIALNKQKIYIYLPRDLVNWCAPALTRIFTAFYLYKEQPQFIAEMFCGTDLIPNSLEINKKIKELSHSSSSQILHCCYHRPKQPLNDLGFFMEDRFFFFMAQAPFLSEVRNSMF